MNLEKLGFGDWFQTRLDASKLESFQLARVSAVHKESYIISNGEWQSRAEVTGKIMFSADSPLDYPTVGDWCFVQYFDKTSPAVIHEILPRKSILKRKTSGKKVEFQAIASNLDYALVVQSLNADFNLRRLERYLVMVREGNIEPVVLFSKSDLVSADEVWEKRNEILKTIPNVQVITFSNNDRKGFKEIENILTAGKTFCLLGSSGVGKTTLLNNLVGETVLATREIREKDGKGKHTTTHRQLLTLSNGSMIIDTPGMRELGNIGVEAGLEAVFDDIVQLEQDCKFNDCTHTEETGCAVLEALDQGAIAPERFQSYAKLQKESDHYEMSYLEKKKKYKELGKLYKSVQKHNRKNKGQ